MLEWSQWLVGADQEKTFEGVLRQTRKFYILWLKISYLSHNLKKLHVNTVTCHLMVLDLSQGDITCW